MSKDPTIPSTVEKHWSPNATPLYKYLWRKHSDKNVVEETQQEIADAIDCSRRVVNKLLKWFENNNIIELESRTGKRYITRIIKIWKEYHNKPKEERIDLERARKKENEYLKKCWTKNNKLTEEGYKKSKIFGDDDFDVFDDVDKENLKRADIRSILDVKANDCLGNIWKRRVLKDRDLHIDIRPLREIVNKLSTNDSWLSWVKSLYRDFNYKSLRKALQSETNTDNLDNIHFLNDKENFQPIIAGLFRKITQWHGEENGNITEDEIYNFVSIIIKQAKTYDLTLEEICEFFEKNFHRFHIIARKFSNYREDVWNFVRDEFVDDIVKSTLNERYRESPNNKISKTKTSSDKNWTTLN